MGAVDICGRNWCNNFPPLICSLLQAFARLAFIFFVVHLAGGLVLTAFYYNFAAFEVYIMSLFWVTRLILAEVVSCYHWHVFGPMFLPGEMRAALPQANPLTGNDRVDSTIPGEDDYNEIYFFQTLAADLCGSGSARRTSSSPPSPQGLDSKIAMVLLVVY